ncbi:dihydroorotate dehydrogenase B catalytic subunit [Sulfoacidibacillus thermotolerans]|uniref:Dihydroorotate dehydrogenase n=2 Tax=Sulfoacidibacillus thermotolerans TaxID=1765684 RepID=A0A2U3D7W6_SULT2|nr:dihydroorotate dehydrogenase B catalytic subunit [Sulfoacidibacillus thermotolerans]
MPASGCFAFGREVAAFYDLNRLGAIVVKATTLDERQGNETPRLAETPAGMLNSIGLQNPGVLRVIDEELPYLQQYDRLPVIVNVAGTAIEDYVQVVERLSQVNAVAAIELNISCPNVKCGGIQFGTDKQMAANMVRAIKQVAKVPVIVKLSPNVTDIVEMAVACEEAGADALSLINTLIGMQIDIEKRRPLLANGVGGLSGPAVKPIAVRMVYEVSSAVNIPVIGIGGIMFGADAVEFLMAGASAVQVGTANFVDPFACVRIIDELGAWCDAHGVRSVIELIGAAKGERGVVRS